jgi:mRNA interferase MazF
VVIEQGQVYWVDLGPEIDSGPAGRRPALVVQGNSFNRSRIGTVVVAAISANTKLARMPGNVFLPSGTAGLPRDCVINVTALVTLDRAHLHELAGELPFPLLAEAMEGLRLVFGFAPAA